MYTKLDIYMTVHMFMSRAWHDGAERLHALLGQPLGQRKRLPASVRDVRDEQRQDRAGFGLSAVYRQRDQLVRQAAGGDDAESHGAGVRWCLHHPTFLS